MKFSGKIFLPNDDRARGFCAHAQYGFDNILVRARNVFKQNWGIIIKAVEDFLQFRYNHERNSIDDFARGALAGD